MGLLTSSYRTGVLNDFSLVSKGVFHIFMRDSNVSIAPTGAKSYFPTKFVKIGDTLPVQINPANLAISYGNDKKLAPYETSLRSKESNGIPIIRMGPGELKESLNITLRYDVYDEYFVRTMDGTLDTDNDLSLLSKDATSLHQLTLYAGRPSYYVLFLWGDLEYFGLLRNVNATYNVFSRWGTPLKASADITIDKQPLGYDSKGIEISPLSSGLISTTDKLAMKSYTSASNKLITAGLAVTQALR